MPVYEQITRVFTVPAGLLFGLCQAQPALAFAFLLVGSGLSVTALAQPDIRDYVSPADPVEDYLEAIDRIEADFGPYTMELSDLYLGLGQSLINAGEYEKARDAYHRGVMVQRVNLGPNSPEQTNHLYLLANIETLLGEPESADKVLQNIYFINKEHYGEDSEEMLPVLKRIYEWYAVARPLGTDITEFEDHDRAIQITEEIVRVSELAYGEGHPLTATAYRRLGEANFQAIMFLTGLEFGPNKDNYVTVKNNEALVPPELASVSPTDYYIDGSRAFIDCRKALLADESLTPSEVANELAIIGDWYLLIEKYRNSVEYYEEGYQALAASADYADQAVEFMSKPRPMHFVDEQRVAFADQPPDDLQGMNLEISMTVTSVGSLRNIEILNAPEEMSKNDLRKIRRQVEKIPFRPAMKDGEVITTREFRWHYEIVAKETAS